MRSHRNRSSEIDTHLAQLCRTASSGTIVIAQMNEKFGRRHPATWRRRARRAGCPWPGRTLVTAQKRAEIKARLGEVCKTASSGHELTLQMNQEFDLTWGEHAYWHLARQADHPWPGGTLVRLTPEQSQYRDQRLRQEGLAGTPGTEIVEEAVQATTMGVAVETVGVAGPVGR